MTNLEPANRLKVLFLARSLELGGTERQLVVLAKALAERGHRVTVALFYPGGPLDAELRAVGLPICSLHKRGRWDLIGPLLQLIGLLRRQRPTVVHGYLPAANIMAALAWMSIRTPKLVFGVRASNMDLSCYDWVSRLTYWAEARLARLADLVIANSETGRREAIARGMPADRLSVIANGVDTARFLPDFHAAERTGPYRIGMVARVDPMKDHDTFLRAARLIVQRRTDVTFVIAGPGTERLAERVVGLPVHLVGSILRPELLIAGLDVAVLSSRFGEGFPNAVAEAMACGVPCAVTNVGDCAQLAAPPLGRVVPPRDPNALAGAILELLDKARNFEFRNACRAHIQQNFSMNILVRRTEAALASLIDTTV